MPWGLSSSWGSNFPMVLPFDGKKNGWRFAVILCPFSLWPSERQKRPSERFISSLAYFIIRSAGGPQSPALGHSCGPRCRAFSCIC